MFPLRIFTILVEKKDVSETWNREELYAEIWEKPLVKIAAKYNISAVALGKVCRKLQIPLPGRGHWTKKEFGKAVEQTPLPTATNLPVVRKMKEAYAKLRGNVEVLEAIDETDPELIRIATVRKTEVPLNDKSVLHKIVSETRQALKQASVDSRGILIRPRRQLTLDIRVSKTMLDRAIRLMNAFIVKIESEGITIAPENMERECANFNANVFGQNVNFGIVERANQTNKREDKSYSWTRVVYDFKPSGLLEFYVGGYSYYGAKTWRDGKARRLESVLSEFVAELMLEGRRKRIAAELRRKEELEQRRKEEELEKLAQQIKEEEKKVRDLNSWVKKWARAKRMRRFIAALEKEWKSQGIELSPESEKGQRILWMRQQADRLDPMIPSPLSILDRKSELQRWH
jgi:hypothetical protein